uniref:Uncharacterized protein n=1 Tax=Glossina pallidipes TaxID=7398 RepID=A0A1B0AH22_GLOPL
MLTSISIQEDTFPLKFTQPQGAGCNKRFYDYGCAVERFKNTNKTSVISQIFTNNCLCKKKVLKSEEELHKYLSNPLLPVKNFKHATARAADISLGGTVPDSVPKVLITFDKPEGTDNPCEFSALTRNTYDVAGFKPDIYGMRESGKG